jgi:transposase
MEMLGKIRRMHLRDKMSLHAIAKQTGLSRNTLRRWLREPDEAAVPTYQRAPATGKLSAFHVTLELALKADAHRNKQNRRTAKALFAQITADGYTGCYSRVTDFIREWRVNEGKTPHAFVPLTFELGEAFQFDWSDEGLVVGGIYCKLQVSHLKLCASRAFWLVAYPGQGHEMLFDAHTRSFAALGGIARRGIYDNMWTWGFAKTAVDKVKKGKGRVVNARFAVMCAHYLFDADFCNVASGWEKVGGGEERAGQPSAHLAGRAEDSVGLLRRTQCLAGRALPCLVERVAPPRVPGIQRAGNAGARARRDDAHANAIRRLCREPGAGEQHLPGHGGTQPLLGAV